MSSSSYGEKVFSTYVEVILSTINFSDVPFSFLHVCGGDPKPDYQVMIEVVFSTYVEVILK